MSFAPIADRDVFFFDSETSGLDSDHHEIVELAAVRLSPDLQTFRGRVERRCVIRHPERFTPEAMRMNGYDAALWAATAVPLRVALVEFAALAGRVDVAPGEEEVVMIGQNPEFDWGFLRRGFREENLRLPVRKYLIDTASMAWPLLVKRQIDKVSLEMLCTRYGVTNAGAHRAMADVQRTIKVYAKMLGLAAPLGGTW